MNDLSLSPVELSAAALLLVVNVLISMWLKLSIGKQILLSGLRMVVQLSLLGLVLKQIFALESAASIVLLATVMTVIAGLSSLSRIESRYPAIHVTAVVSVWASSWLVTAVMILVIVRPTPWHAPQIMIPLLGMVLGNSLTAISLAMDRFIAQLNERRMEVELLLSLGATRWEATRSIYAASARTAMIPILNTMSVAGIVSIPGMMTGQILAGASPVHAVTYQVMIMFVIAAAIAIGIFVALGISFYRVTTPDHQLKL